MNITTQSILANNKLNAKDRQRMNAAAKVGDTAMVNAMMDSITLRNKTNAEQALSRSMALLASDCDIVVCFSGGKDSVAMVLQLLEMGVDRKRIVLMHHLVGKLWDWGCTEQYCEAFARHFGLKLLYSYRKGGISREIMRTNEGLQDIYYQTETAGKYHKIESKKGSSTRQKFPAIGASLMTRWCSAVVKIDVCKSVVRKMYPDNASVLILTGERGQESANRAKYNKAELHGTTSTGKEREVYQLRPVLDILESEVWALMQRHGITAHPAYHAGWGRCSCQICIFNSADVFATISEYQPSKIDGIRDLEAATGHTMKRSGSIDQFISKGKPMDVDAYWWLQATQNFTHPIHVSPDSWTLPAGAYKEGACGSV